MYPYYHRQLEEFSSTGMQDTLIQRIFDGWDF
jgi:hypothetical protein